MKTFVGDGARDARWLALAFFIQGAALGAWSVPFPVYLGELGLAWLIAYIGILSGTASFLVPMFGALADNRIAADSLYRGLSFASAGVLLAVFLALDGGANYLWVLVLLLLHWVLYLPTWAMLSTIAFANLRDRDGGFLKVRVFATFGWMGSGVMVSYVLKSDANLFSGVFGVLLIMMQGAVGYFLPVTPSLGLATKDWRQNLGLGALDILKDGDQRVFFLTTFLMAMPLCAFYPYTPKLLNSLGREDVAGLMSLGQIMEVVALLTLVGLMKRWRIKWLISAGLGAALVRYLLYLVGVVSGQALWVMIGISLHGIAYTFHMVTGQVFLEKRVGAERRGQAQALLSSFHGTGTLLGAFLIGQWFLISVERPATANWVLFWALPAMAIASILTYFMLRYRGRAGLKS